MSEEELIRIEFQSVLDKLVSSKIRPTATEIISARQSMVQLFEEVMFKLEILQIENTELKEVNKKLEEKLHEKNMRIIELNKLLGDKV